jgi:sporulation protein YlmC with PRC-barrel domain/CBS domain-containing protein
MIFFTELDRLPVHGIKGEYLGRLVDLGINPSLDPLMVTTYIVKSLRGELFELTHEQIPSLSVHSVQTRLTRTEIRPHSPAPGIMQIRKDILDQQIIDTNQRRVVRVNDVEFDIAPMDGHIDLRILSVEVGWGAAIRRLLQGLLAKYLIRGFSQRFPKQSIPWEFVNLIEPDPSRRVRLKISYDKLSSMHPADLADILQELSYQEQQSVIESLDNEVAAKTLSEISRHTQLQLVKGLEVGKAADIVEEMQPEKAADLLQELPSETSAALLAEMEAQDAREVQGLLEYGKDTAGGLMTTDFLALRDSNYVQDFHLALKEYRGNQNSLQTLYLTNSRSLLIGAIPLPRLFLPDRTKVLRDLADISVVTATPRDDTKKVAALFRKYNLLNLPVVNDDYRILGVVTADAVFESLIKES